MNHEPGAIEPLTPIIDRKEYFGKIKNERSALLMEPTHQIWLRSVMWLKRTKMLTNYRRTE